MQNAILFVRFYGAFGIMEIQTLKFTELGHVSFVR